MIYLSFVKLYFLSSSKYVQFNHINLDIKISRPFLPHFTYAFRIGSAMRFFKNASKMHYAPDKGRKTPFAILRGRAQKMCVHSPKKKVAEESKNDENVDFRRT